MAVQTNGFATPASVWCTSDARRLGQSSILGQKCSKHIMFLIILLDEPLTAKIRPGDKTMAGVKMSVANMSVSLESGEHFMKIVKNEHQK